VTIQDIRVQPAFHVAKGGFAQGLVLRNDIDRQPLLALDLVLDGADHVFGHALWRTVDNAGHQVNALFLKRVYLHLAQADDLFRGLVPP